MRRAVTYPKGTVPRRRTEAAHVPQAPRSKYRAVKTEVDGIRFDSKAEARRYVELKALEKAGEIRGLLVQPSYPLDAFGVESRPIGVYRADFSYERLVDLGPTDRVGEYFVDTQHYGTGRPSTPRIRPRPYSKAATWPGMCARWDRVVEDVKGFKTPLYRWKKKHVEAQYGITIIEIR